MYNEKSPIIRDITSSNRPQNCLPRYRKPINLVRRGETDGKLQQELEDNLKFVESSRLVFNLYIFDKLNCTKKIAGQRHTKGIPCYVLEVIAWFRGWLVAVLHSTSPLYPSWIQQSTTNRNK